MIDPAQALLAATRRLAETGLLAPPRAGRAFFWTSGDPGRLYPVLARLWGGDVDLAPLP